MHKKNNQYSSVLEANVDKYIYINYLDRKVIPTGLYMEVDKLKRKNFFIKKKLINTGTICLIHISEKKKYPSKTNLYIEIQIVIINISLKSILIKPDQKIAIMEIYQENEIKWKKCSILHESIRGENSFGSTGI
ncbi:deoxyuridine 5'-triphosphate nucleotidohydrolase [Blattabacterium cuenoti]|uniref:deoxyuridine 5'-triphosphate nucleotidohydrolase n=1 Tax=Blattabacterium cuenoti TaxID=1653831 RepID=UPI00163CBDFF|nr:deoxyuridine 5'-triphosphate nucleotidohydrolase [Blattabacterium cuenoti]